MSLFVWFIQNPVKVSVGVLLVSLFGAISLITMPKQLIPEVQNPILSVRTTWPGASPQEIEREIVQEQEEQLAAVEGLVKMSSTCSSGSSSITLEFAVGTNIEDAMMRVNTRLQQVREYPVNAQEPVIEASSVADSPIARFALTARPPSIAAIEAFQLEHPELAEALEPARRAVNTGLRVFRLQEIYNELQEQHPELVELLPPEADLQAIRKLAEDLIEPQFERVPGVAEAETYGGQDEELQVIIDPERLASRQLTIEDVRVALMGHNRDTSAGELWEGKRRWVIRTLGQFRSPEHVKSQVLRSEGGTPIYVRDVADVVVSYKKADSLSRRYGLTSNGLSVRRSSDANVLEVMKGVQKVTADLNAGLLDRLGLELFQYYDETEYIKSAISLVQQNIFVGGALTIIVLMLFLHLGRKTLLAIPVLAASALASVYISPWFFLVTVGLTLVCGLWFGRGALVVGLAIPVSIIGTFLLLGLMGRSLNVISLAGLAFAVGMLVDNAVVVLENIYRRREMGESAAQAASGGTAEVAGAVVASTLTTIAVFVPVLFVQETSGQLFRDIALAISCAVGLSLVVSFTMIPAAAARLFHGSQTVNRRSSGETASSELDAAPDGAPRSSGRLVGLITAGGNRFAGFIAGMNRWVIERRSRSIALVVSMILFSLSVSYLLWPKVEYLPSGNRNFVFCSLSPPPGYNIEQLMVMGERLEKDLQPYWDVDPGSPEAALLPYPTIDYYFYAVRGTSVFMGFRTTDESRIRELIPLVREAASKFKGTRALVKQSSLFERGLTGGRTIDIEITGGDLNKLIAVGTRVMDDVQRLIPSAQASPQPSLDIASPEVHVYPKRIEAAEMGVNAAELGYAVDAFIDGAYAGDYYVDGDKIDLTIKGGDTFAQRTQDINWLPISTSSGQIVPLEAVADVQINSGPESIMRRERLRAITISVTPPLTMPLEEAMQLIDQQIVDVLHEEGVIDGDTMVSLSGTADKLREAWDALSWNLALALAITYLLMAALFESWLYPFVIILTVPLGAVGGVLGLFVLNFFIFQSLDVLTMLGFVILVGTVVNNAILIVHQSLHYMRDGMAPRQAVPESVRTRIRPIFITTTTTVLGLLPLVVFPGAGSELYRGLGAVVLGGLILSTAFTLFLVPAVFVLTMDAKQFVMGLFQRVAR
ncbi:efflux RND transporter permease subunit [Aureliella helgolandensis]|uniref:Multidrug resistance protein MdtB n=1 Tax=Aureliella helgolandensis TaxID=2527968 RepID=A0A518G1D6_9BACT|nr:efflux RND transporter permease subunit [Aureliella helgolandensis]QDV22415.1 Multidrug resistance protein MdtB [Aureliella helgolandensis]